MSAPSRCVFLEIDHTLLLEIQEVRVELDPLADKIAPHIPLIFTFRAEIPLGDLISLLGSIAPTKPFPISLGKPAALGTNLYYPIDKGGKEIVALRTMIYEMLPDLTAPGDHAPYLSFGHLIPGTDPKPMLAKAETALRGTPYGALSALVLERIGDSGESIEEFRAKIG